MSVRRRFGLAAMSCCVAACFNGDNAQGLACENDAQCGTNLQCVRQSPDDELGICGGAPSSSTVANSTDDPTTGLTSSGSTSPPNDSSDTSGTTEPSDSSGSDETTGPGPTACGALPPMCQGVPALDSVEFETLWLPSKGTTGDISAAIGYFVGDDEWEDIAVANLLNSSVVIYENNQGMGFSGPRGPFFTLTNPYDIAAGDFDCDGNSDLAAVALDSGQMALAYGAGSTLGQFDTDSPVVAGDPWSLAIADFDPDFEGSDIVVGSDDFSLLFRNDGAGGFSGSETIAAGSATWSVTAGDIDSDGIPDIVIANSDQYEFLDTNNDDYITIALSSTDFTSESYSVPSFTNPIDAGLLELDGNAGLDMVVVSKHINGEQTSSTLEGSMSLHANDGTGHFSPIRVDIPLGAGANAVATADFNCDGATDIAVGHDTAAEVRVFWGPGYTVKDQTVVELSTAIGTRMEVGDLNHDGYPDLAIANYGDPAPKGGGMEDGGLSVIWRGPR